MGSTIGGATTRTGTSRQISDRNQLKDTHDHNIYYPKYKLKKTVTKPVSKSLTLKKKGKLIKNGVPTIRTTGELSPSL